MIVINKFISKGNPLGKKSRDLIQVLHFKIVWIWIFPTVTSHVYYL